MRLTPGIEVFDQTAFFTSLFYKVIQRSEQQRLNVSAGSYNMKFFPLEKYHHFEKFLSRSTRILFWFTDGAAGRLVLSDNEQTMSMKLQVVVVVVMVITLVMVLVMVQMVNR